MCARCRFIAEQSRVGFHVSQHTTTGLDPWSEALNELSKTLWAAAYFVPLLRARQFRITRPAETFAELGTVTEDSQPSSA